MFVLYERQHDALAKPVITAVRDLESGRDDTLTRGGFLDIRGANLCIGGEDFCVLQ